MTWQFSQSAGTLTNAAGEIVGTGYSGRGPGLNNPAMQEVKNVGPLPRGLYRLSTPIQDDPVVGEFAIPLVPDFGNEMFSRGGFFIHGNDPQNDHAASEGCIVMPFTTRQQIWASGDHELEVVI
jgi:Tlde1 domain